MTNLNEPSMPVTAGNNVHSIGLTKREYMATKIMAAYIAGSSVGIANGSPLDYECLANEAVKATDSLIKRLNSEEES